jgi:aldehyde:ferredoxin oxidoreductase
MGFNTSVIQIEGDFMFKILKVDLTKRSFSESSVPQEYTSFLGGRGLAVRLFSDLVSPNTKPLAPENMMIFSAGALINSKIPMSGRSNATSLSPLTDTIFSSNVGGMFGHHLSATGYEVLIISGVAESPSYLAIGKENSLEDASKIWGYDVFESTDVLMNKHAASEGQISVIGPAGENKNHFGNIMVQKHRAFGRGGLGAVFGSKNLKGMVFLGGESKREEKYDELAKRLKDKIAQIKNKLKTQGTTGVLNTAQRNKALPTYYFRTNHFEHADQINGEEMEKHKVRSGTCYSCPVACKMIERSEKYDIVTDGPEYETIVFLGSNLGISNLDAIIKSNHLCDRFGLDTISTGNIIGALIEGAEEGKLDYKIGWDDEEKVHELLEKIALNKEIGSELQRGTNAFCKKFGIEAQTVKGLDVPGHDPRALHGVALSYATSNRGADHLYSTTYKDEYNHELRQNIKGKAKLVIKNENRNAVLDSLGLCKFSTSFYKDQEYIEILGVLLDREVTIEEFLGIGSEIVDMERALNNKRGFGSKDDVLPERVMVPNLKEELSGYYRLRGWDEDGKVKKEI